MRAWVLEKIGEGPVLKTIDTPTPTVKEALIRLEAAALNRRDVYIRDGQYPGVKTPVVLGSDGCGEVVQCPSEPSWEGKRVIICPSLDWGPREDWQGLDYHILGLPTQGTLAEEIVVPRENLFPAPAHLKPSEAAALPLAHLTAWRAVVTRGQVQTNQSVLVTGLGGGVALAALQIAAGHGARVWGSSSCPEKIQRAIELGAEGGFLYTDEGWASQAAAAVSGGFDLIIDGAGGKGVGDLVRLLAPAGRLVFYGGTRGKWPAILPQYLFFKQVSLLASTMGSPREFGDLVRWVDEQNVIPAIDRTFSFNDVDQAFQRLQSGAQTGKVVVQIAGDSI